MATIPYRKGWKSVKLRVNNTWTWEFWLSVLCSFGHHFFFIRKSRKFRYIAQVFSLWLSKWLEAGFVVLWGVTTEVCDLSITKTFCDEQGLKTEDIAPFYQILDLFIIVLWKSDYESFRVTYFSNHFLGNVKNSYLFCVDLFIFCKFRCYYFVETDT